MLCQYKHSKTITKETNHEKSSDHNNLTEDHIPANIDKKEKIILNILINQKKGKVTLVISERIQLSVLQRKNTLMVKDFTVKITVPSNMISIFMRRLTY